MRRFAGALAVACLCVVSLLACGTLVLASSPVRHHSHHAHAPPRTFPSTQDWQSACLRESAGSSRQAASSLTSDSFGEVLLPTVPSLTLIPGRNESCLAFGYFTDAVESTGWSYLHVQTPPASESEGQAVSALDLAYAAGWLEGQLTAPRVWQHKLNAFANNFNDSTPEPATLAWVQQQLDYNNKQIKAANSSDFFWHELERLYVQLQGLGDGYNLALAPPAQPLTLMDLLLINLSADIDDIVGATTPAEKRQDHALLSRAGIMSSEQKRGHCSSIIKVTPDGQLLHGQSHTRHGTWWSYAFMLRIYKTYILPFSGGPGVSSHFSSFPATLFSMDDFYTISETKLTVTETTNVIWNHQMYDKITPLSVAPWARCVIANRWSRSGSDWTALFARENSGTNGNQWMVLDHKLFSPVPGAPLQDGLLWIVEQEPGLILRSDVTSVLREQSYWASYNRPWHTQIFADLGFAALEAKWAPEGFGEFYFSYNASFRAEMFRREAGGIGSVSDMQRVITLNQWQTDPLARNCSSLAIAARSDLALQSDGCREFTGIDSDVFPGGATGLIDAKITTYAWMQTGAGQALAQSGPTHADQSPFVWSQSAYNDEVKHEGHPDRFDFDWQTFPPPPQAQQIIQNA